MKMDLEMKSEIVTEKEKEEAEESENGNDIKNASIESPSKWRARTLKELVICYFACTNCTLLVAYPIFYVMDRSLPFLLISGIDEQTQNALIVCTCLVADIILQLQFLAYSFFLIWFALFFQYTIQENIKNQIQCVKGLGGGAESKSSPVDAGESLRAYRELEVRMHLFNIFNSSVLFVAKLGLIACAVLSGFSAIRLQIENPAFTLIYMSVFLNVNVGYISMFDPCRQTSEGLEDLKLEMWRQSTRYRQKEDLVRSRF